MCLQKVCGSPYNKVHPCQCDAQCTTLGDCCSDYVYMCCEEGTDPVWCKEQCDAQGATTFKLVSQAGNVCATQCQCVW
eukprot:m.140234 g.140234  ORF g.140234 m.140234 type:complete len:78 (+) comp13180_c0_seq2:4049-4282(+)